MRKLNAPIDALLLEPSSIPRSESALSATCLEYDPSMPNRAKQIPSWHTSRCSFLNSFHLKIKNELPICRYCDELQQKSPNNSGEDKWIMCQYEAHLGPVHGLHRHLHLPKIFLTVLDWTTNVRTEDIRDSPILTLKCVRLCLLTSRFK
jgi:dynein intermediate chain 2